MGKLLLISRNGSTKSKCHFCLKDRIRVTFLQQDGNEPNTLDDALDNAQDDGTQEQCTGRKREENDEVVGVTQDTLPEQEPLTRKRKNQEINSSASANLMRYLIESKKEERDHDPIDTFFSLMATTVKKFSPADQHLIKTKVFSIVSDTEGK